ncbi:MAG: hypothetical protein IPH63_15720 [Flavobacteriales bacterium]|nr:hypothetical protein [Flavobacteriales bacterium]
MFRKPLLILGILLMAVTANATHMSGGEIYWECIGNNQYRIRLLVYRDCAGINVDPTYNLELTSPCGDRNLTVTSNGGTELSHCVIWNCPTALATAGLFQASSNTSTQGPSLFHPAIRGRSLGPTSIGTMRS